MQQIIVTGCPRSGTRRLHAAFGQAKVNASHESDNDLTISCFLAVDEDAYPTGHAPYWDREVDEIWHITRHPLDCIASMAARIPHHFWVWQLQFTGLHPGRFRSRREFAAHFWVAWNEYVEERRPDWRFRVEDMEQVWPEMWKRAGLGEAPPIDPRSAEYQGLGRDDAGETIYPLTWEELGSWGPTVHDGVRRKADEYGYE